MFVEWIHFSPNSNICRKTFSRSLFQEEGFEIWGCFFVSELKLRSTSSAEQNFPDDITWTTWKKEQNLEIWPFLNSLLEMWESGKAAGKVVKKFYRRQWNSFNKMEKLDHQLFEIWGSCGFFNKRDLWETMHLQTKCWKLSWSTDGNDPYPYSARDTRLADVIHILQETHNVCAALLDAWLGRIAERYNHSIQMFSTMQF